MVCAIFLLPLALGSKYMLLDQKGVLAEANGAEVVYVEVDKDPSNPLVCKDEPWELQVSSHTTGTRTHTHTQRTRTARWDMRMLAR